MHKLYRWLWALGLAAPLMVQSTAMLRGRVLDPSGAVVEGAVASLENALSGYGHHTLSDAEGVFVIANIPLQEYMLRVVKEGLAPQLSTVSLRTNVRLELTVRLGLAAVSDEVQATAFAAREMLDVEATGTRTQLNLAQIERIPVPSGARGLGSLLLSFPGFAADANGAIQPRGAHNQMTYVIDGVPISDQLTGSFGNGVDSSIVQTIELFTGDIPAEFGSKISAVANITTRSGLSSKRRFFSSLEQSASQFDTLGSVAQIGGQIRKFGYFFSLSAQKSNRFLDQVSLENLHNGGNAQRGFGRLDYQLGDADFLRLNLLAGRSSFQLANLRSQHAHGQDQRQWLRDAAVSVGLVHVISPAATFDTTNSYRTSIAQLFPSAGDTPVTAAQARHLSYFTTANRVNVIMGRHELRMGLDYQRFPVSENFSFAITDPSFNDPGQEGYIPTLAEFDLSRSGRWFHFADRGTGNHYSGFGQVKLRLGPMMASVGVRMDRYSFLVKGSQLQPRIGFSYQIRSYRDGFARLL
ncbi:MAG: carboxypeptidase regulatory-like domain-containing protein [Bryobacteraceae bacterium]